MSSSFKSELLKEVSKQDDPVIRTDSIALKFQTQKEIVVKTLLELKSEGHIFFLVKPGGDLYLTHIDGEEIEWSLEEEDLKQGLFDMEGNLVGINTFKTTGYGAYFSMPAEWIHRLRTLPAEKEFPINGKALWEEAEDTKPYFLKIAIPKIKEDWETLKYITDEWTKKEKNNTEAWYENGLVNEKLNHIDIAKISYEKAIEIDPKNTDALLKIAIIIHSEGNTTKVENIKTKLKELHPAKADELDEIITCKKDC